MTREELDKLEVGTTLWSMKSMEQPGEWEDPYPIIYLGYDGKNEEFTVRAALKSSGGLVIKFDNTTVYPSVAAALEGKIEAMDRTILELKDKRSRYERMLEAERREQEEQMRKLVGR